MQQQPHRLLPEATHDEFAREEFCASLRKMFTTELWPGCREVYTKTLVPKYRERTGREPGDIREAETLLEESFYYRAVNLLGRTAQEMVWDTVGESIERQLDDLIEAARPRGSDLGGVRTNPALPIPRYVDAVDIHVMPGNFHTELTRDDVYAGALYDRGVHVFSFGGLGPQNAAYGDAVVAFLQANFPDFAPERALDLGTGIGNVALPLADAFPEAEIHGADIGAPMVRYAHGRAEALGKKVYFAQQDASATDYPDGYFDLVTTMLLTHECPAPKLHAIFKEIYRILRPGGIMMHDGFFERPDRAPIDEIIMSWYGANANEPFTAGYKKLDFGGAFEKAGFDPALFFSGSRPAVYLQGTLPDVNFIGAVKT